MNTTWQKLTREAYPDIMKKENIVFEDKFKTDNTRTIYYRGKEIYIIAMNINHMIDTIHDTKQILEDEYVLSDELCKGCSCDCTSSNLGRRCEKDNKYDICWYKAHQHAKALLKALDQLV